MPPNDPPPARPSPLARAATRIEVLLVSAFLVTLVCLVAVQVAARYLFHSPPVWTEEFARYCLVWLTFLGAGLLAGKRAHITVQAMDRVLGRRGVIVLRGIAEIVTVAVSAILIMASTSFLERVSHQSSAAGQIPMSLVYAALPIGFLLVAAHSVLWVVRDLRELAGGPPAAGYLSTTPHEDEAGGVS